MRFGGLAVVWCLNCGRIVAHNLGTAAPKASQMNFRMPKIFQHVGFWGSCFLCWGRVPTDKRAEKRRALSTRLAEPMLRNTLSDWSRDCVSATTTAAAATARSERTQVNNVHIENCAPPVGEGKNPKPQFEYIPKTHPDPLHKTRREKSRN